ncbi:hypothetical protein SI859A1_00983 [Aurantimonas manganoxydans SI85-9A1]|uniref:Uncharacterized protein n=1 Tax=Aurantimonas manganoxydans (strain ATCC BAA-1229 / DSM 21871 / SI85-9A1) TaxID=287752 RepID=Q1YJL6_AURMS|nr:hypothetical protein SI859A1_00983 [Aurantimonas manganoxydans SI85-9A1]
MAAARLYAGRHPPFRQTAASPLHGYQGYRRRGRRLDHRTVSLRRHLQIQATGPLRRLLDDQGRKAGLPVVGRCGAEARVHRDADRAAAGIGAQSGLLDHVLPAQMRAGGRSLSDSGRGRRRLNRAALARSRYIKRPAGGSPAGLFHVTCPPPVRAARRSPQAAVVFRWARSIQANLSCCSMRAVARSLVAKSPCWSATSASADRVEERVS